MDPAHARDLNNIRENIHDLVKINGAIWARDDVLAQFVSHTDAVPDVASQIEELGIEGEWQR